MYLPRFFPKRGQDHETLPEQRSAFQDARRQDRAYRVRRRDARVWSSHSFRRQRRTPHPDCPYKVGEKHRRITLGNVAKVNFEHARREAKKIFNRVGLGQDPQADKVEARKVASHTLDAAIKKYLAARKDDMRPSTYDQVKHHLVDQI